MGVDAALSSPLPSLCGLPPLQGFELPLELGALWRYLAFVQALPAWQEVDYGSKKIIEGWGKHH